MKKHYFYFKGIENVVVIEAETFEKAVEIADNVANYEIDVDRTVTAFFKNN